MPLALRNEIPVSSLLLQNTSSDSLFDPSFGLPLDPLRPSDAAASLLSLLGLAAIAGGSSPGCGTGIGATRGAVDSLFLLAASAAASFFRCFSLSSR